MKKKIFVFLVALFIVCPFTVNAEDISTTENVLNGLITENGYTYYYVNGVKQTGFQTIDGYTYFFSREGNNAMKVGLTWIDDEYYNFGSDGIMQVNSWYDVKGERSYFGSDGKRVKAFQTIDGNTYFFSREGNNAMKVGITWIDDEYYNFGSDGIMQVNSWYKANSNKYYFGSDGKRVRGFQTIDGNTYFFSRDNDNPMRTGFFLIDDYYYYFDAEGIMQTGWHEIGGDNKYFLSDGKMATTLTQIDQDFYAFDEQGNMLTGFQVISDKTYYFDKKTGIAKIGLQDIGKETYYFDSFGVMLTGFQVIDGNTYFFSRDDGRLRTGFFWIDDYYYYFDAEGIMQTGWINMEEGTRYFDPTTGKMQIGIVQIENNKYYFNDEGIQEYGFIVFGNNTYFFSRINNHEMRIGLIWIDGYNYYFNDEGIMQIGFHVVDGITRFFSRVDGKMRTGWVLIDGYMYYFGLGDGAMAVGNHTIDGVNYIFNENGTLRDGFVTDTDGNIKYYYPDGTYANDWVTIAGTKYFFNSLGVMIGENVKKIIDVSAWQDVIDWDTVISQGGVDGVILRIAAGCEEEDAMLARNIAELQRLGVPYGIYIYSYAENYNEGVLYANFTLDIIRKYNMNPTLGIFLDLESNSVTSYMGTYEYEQVTRGFMDVMNSNGYGSLAKIYTYTNYAETVLNSDYLKSLIAWVAQYNHYCYYSGSYVGWQYSSSESIPGITGNVDVSVWF